MREDHKLEQFQNKEYMSFELRGAIKQLDWAVFAIEI